MAGIQRPWDIKRVYLVIGSYEITGFGAADAITIAPESDAVEHTAGADGEVAVSRTDANRHVVTINASQLSAGFRDLAALAKEQAAADTIEPLAFLARDLNTGTTYRSRYATFLNRPEIAFGKSAGEGEFKILLPDPDIEYGSTIV